MVGNGEFGVIGNNEKVSFGGKLIHNLLKGGKHVLVNNTKKCFGVPFTRVDRENLQDGMNTLDNCGIHGKLYRLIYKLNRKTVLKVKTGVGLSESTELGENITQGSIGGALMITFNLDYIVNNHFQKKSATAI